MSLSLSLATAATAIGQSTFDPVADNTIFEGETGNSSGAGSVLFVGRLTGLVSDPPRNRRALVRFDVSTIPADAVVTSAVLDLTVVRVPPSPTTPTVSLHRLLQPFGEGSSAGLGAGSAAVPPDATWIHRITPSTAWGSPGGLAGTDYVATASAVDADGGIGSTGGMVADVQAWVDGSAPNHGWMLIGDELTSGSVRGYGSRELSSALQRPRLTVQWSAAATPTPTATPGSPTPVPTVPGGDGSGVLEIPTAGHRGLALLSALLAVLGLAILAFRRPS